jgi:hypothetical protein
VRTFAGQDGGQVGIGRGQVVGQVPAARRRQAADGDVQPHRQRPIRHIGGLQLDEIIG